MAAVTRSRPLQPFGWEAELAHAELTDADRGELRDLLARDGLLLLRGVSLTMAEQSDLCRSFGPVPDSPYENFFVSNTRADGFLGARELQWHNDVPYLPSPYRVAALHAVEVGADATSTRFVSGYRALERLPAGLRNRIDGLNALQVRQRLPDRANRLADLEPGDLCTVHPVVARSRESGRPYVFVNENMTACVIGLSEADSDALLAEVFAQFYTEADIYEHNWEVGDLLVWDNLAVQHARGRVGDGPRTLQRVTCTDFTYLQQYPADGIGTELNNAVLLAPADA